MSETSPGEPAVLQTDQGIIPTTYRCLVVRSYAAERLYAVVPPNNPLVTVLGPDLLVQTADQWGPFWVKTRLLDREPVDPGPEWEDVVEVSITSSEGLMVTELVNSEPRVHLVSGPGDYRLRVSGRGRSIPDYAEDEDEDDDNESPKEWYLLETWPAPIADPVVVRLTSPWAERVLSRPTPPSG